MAQTAPPFQNFRRYESLFIRAMSCCQSVQGCSFFDIRKIGGGFLWPQNQQKAAKLAEADNSFSRVVNEWYLTKSPKWPESHKARTRRLLGRDLFLGLPSHVFFKGKLHISLKFSPCCALLQF